MKIKNIKKIKCNSKRYDIEIKNNHNFFANNILVHNCSFYVEYLDGKPIFAATRGDGFYGKDITDKAKIFCPDIPKKNKHAFRCEAMLIGDKYKELGFKNARNGVAGILNRDDNEQCEYIMPFFHEIIEGYPKACRTENSRMDYLVLTLELSTPDMGDIDDNIEMITELLSEWKSNANYKIDGLVITVNDSVRENVEFPKNKIAFKVNEEGIETNVRDIEWNVTRTGRIVPVVIIDSVEIGGVTVQRATGFNAKFIKDNLIGEGSKIKIVRSGDVIPYITEVEKSVLKTELPENCPSCNSILEWKGVDLVCNNINCGEAMYYRVEHFLRRMGAENITYKTLMKLGLDEIKSCYEIDEWEIASIDGFGVKRAQQIIDEIQGTLNTSPEAFISAFGIPNAGRTVSKLLMEHYNGDIEKFFEATKDDLLEVNGIGDIIAWNIMDCMDDLYDLYKYLLEKGLQFEEKMLKLDGMNICLTGTGPIARGPLQKMIEMNGGNVKSISKSIDILVAADPSSQSGKAKKAREYGIEIISYEDLLERIK